MQKVALDLIREMLIVPLGHLRRLTTRDTPEWFALHRRLVQRLRIYGVETLLNPSEENATEDASISRLIFGDEIQMCRLVREQTEGTWRYVLRGSRFIRGDDGMILGTYMVRPLRKNVAVAVPSDDLMIILAANSRAAASDLGVAVARAVL